MPCAIARADPPGRIGVWTSDRKATKLVPVTTTETTAAALGTSTPSLTTEETATRVFSTSILISAVRCTLAYVVFPWVLPALGLASGVGPGIGLAVGVVAIGFNIASIRRFHRSDHAWKWPITALNCIVIALLAVLAGIDISDLLG